jgi:NADH:ubiquinone oxidoreductase subunit
MNVLSRWIRLGKKIHQTGYWTSLKRLIKTRELNFGTVVGVDQFGNKYYEDKDPVYWSKARWVEFAKEAEASTIPPEWHSWLHHISDEIPTRPDSLLAETTPKYRQEHVPNMTGTPEAYSPPTWVGSANWQPVRPPIQIWTPPTELFTLDTKTSDTSATNASNKNDNTNKENSTSPTTKSL